PHAERSPNRGASPAWVSSARREGRPEGVLDTAPTVQLLDLVVVLVDVELVAGQLVALPARRLRLLTKKWTGPTGQRRPAQGSSHQRAGRRYWRGPIWG